MRCSPPRWTVLLLVVGTAAENATLRWAALPVPPADPILGLKALFLADPYDQTVHSLRRDPLCSGRPRRWTSPSARTATTTARRGSSS